MWKEDSRIRTTSPGIDISRIPHLKISGCGKRLKKWRGVAKTFILKMEDRFVSLMK
jgi:hypothetical protein